MDTPEKLVEKGQEVGLGALKCAIEAIGDAIADLGKGQANAVRYAVIFNYNKN